MSAKRDASVETCGATIATARICNNNNYSKTNSRIDWTEQEDVASDARMAWGGDTEKTITTTTQLSIAITTLIHSTNIIQADNLSKFFLLAWLDQATCYCCFSILVVGICCCYCTLRHLLLLLVRLVIQHRAAYRHLLAVASYMQMLLQQQQQHIGGKHMHLPHICTYAHTYVYFEGRQTYDKFRVMYNNSQ